MRKKILTWCISVMVYTMPAKVSTLNFLCFWLLHPSLLWLINSSLFFLSDMELLWYRVLWVDVRFSYGITAKSSLDFRYKMRFVFEKQFNKRTAWLKCFQDVAKEFNVTGMPTFVLLKKGEEKDRIIGAKKDELERKVVKFRAAWAFTINTLHQ